MKLINKFGHIFIIGLILILFINSNDTIKKDFLIGTWKYSTYDFNSNYGNNANVFEIIESDEYMNAIKFNNNGSFEIGFYENKKFYPDSRYINGSWELYADNLLTITYTLSLSNYSYIDIFNLTIYSNNRLTSTLSSSANPDYKTPYRGIYSRYMSRIK